MKKIVFTAIITLTVLFPVLASQQPEDTTVYLITCAPGTETYSLWGHSALRVIIPSEKSDMVYNWGVFDFETPHFAWKFAKGRLNYMLGVYSFRSFIQDYFLENRSVISQKINLVPIEKLRLMVLLNENMKPENRDYRYDFLYDNCSTRIRDIIEKLIGIKMIYPPDEPEHSPSFRDKISEFTRSAPWTKLGIDILVGSPADKKTTFRGRMFLPDDLQRNLTQAVINRDRKMYPLLQPAETILDFPAENTPPLFYASPVFIFTLLFIFLVFLSARYRQSAIMNYIDIALFLVFSILALLMIFFNFFTDHIETRWNLNILWFSPFIFICLWSLIRNKNDYIWFRIVFFITVLFVPLIFVIPDSINKSLVPIIFILLLRSSVRAGFKWNALSAEDQETH